MSRPYESNKEREADVFRAHELAALGQVLRSTHNVHKIHMDLIEKRIIEVKLEYRALKARLGAHPYLD